MKTLKNNAGRSQTPAVKPTKKNIRKGQDDDEGTSRAVPVLVRQIAARDSEALQIVKAAQARKRGRPDDAMLGERIRYMRTHVLGLDTQQELANVMGVTRGAVGNWEQGRGIKREHLDAICTRFGISVQWLRTGTGEIMFAPEPSKIPPHVARMTLLPPADYDYMAESFESQITVYLDYVKRRDNRS